MARKTRSPPPKTVWAYAYQLVPPQTEDRLGTIKSVLDHEHAEARRGARTWTGSVVLEQQVTHILVVSDSPQQDREVNRRLEARLKHLKMGFALTSPMLVADDAAAAPPVETRAEKESSP